jgi:hypothetical protein
MRSRRNIIPSHWLCEGGSSFSASSEMSTIWFGGQTSDVLINVHHAADADRPASHDPAFPLSLAWAGPSTSISAMNLSQVSMTFL